MSSRRRFSSLSSTPSGRMEGVLLDRYRPASPSASYLFTHDLKAAVLTLFAAQKSASLTPGLLL